MSSHLSTPGLRPIPPPPYDEALRLAALASYDILDTPRERDFDDVAALASALCGTPIGVVNLIGDGRQFFKAEVGLGVRETPLASSFCAKAILEEEFLLVPDATKDPRFECNPLVTGAPSLRFYAGALLRTEEGLPIGTVCVLDFQPRRLTDLQQQALRVLARQVMKQLELRRALAERDRAEERRSILIQELGHRLKNTLAIVQSVAGQTLKGVTERSAVETFERRLIALGRAHDVLLQENWASAPMRAIAERVLSLTGESRIAIAGPDVQFGSRATLSTSLVLHELATNATKYGALSADGGTVDLSWRREPGPDGEDFVLTWRETGGPPPAEPSRTGFGTRLIRLGLAGTGGVTIRYPDSGFVAEFRSALSAVALS